WGIFDPRRALPSRAGARIFVPAPACPGGGGGAPVQAAIRAGDDESGVTIMLLDAGLDTGPILAQCPVALKPDETGQSLHNRLAQLGAELLLRAMPRYLAGDITPEAQDDTLATYAPQIKKADGRIDWTRPAVEIDRLVRAFTPWPGAFTAWNGKQLKIVAGRAEEGQAPAGQAAEINGMLAIGTGAGLYLPTALQLAGKKPLPAADFVNGYRDFLGARLN
ncbi:MAG: methionyl-tRNA formyltransferase, partial [Chloroflexi bacterium]|nr:methionyl-tRNA formyltransferase [Chloroflexota bacterium]